MRYSAKSGLNSGSTMGIMAIVALAAAFVIPVLAQLCSCPEALRSQIIVQRMMNALDEYRLRQAVPSYPVDLGLVRNAFPREAWAGQLCLGALSLSAGAYRISYRPAELNAQARIEHFVLVAEPESGLTSPCASYITDEGGTLYLDCGKRLAAIDRDDRVLAWGQTSAGEGLSTQ